MLLDLKGQCSKFEPNRTRFSESAFRSKFKDAFTWRNWAKKPVFIKIVIFIIVF